MVVVPEEITITIPPPRAKRSDGVHVTSIIRCIATEAGILKPEWCEELSLLEVKPGQRFSDPVVALRVCMGLAWEEWYVRQLEDVLDHPHELSLDGIYLSIDGESLSFVHTGLLAPVIHEFKTTYKSMNTVGDLTNQWMWLSQIKAYCWVKGTYYAELHVLYICGDYSYPIQPRLVKYKLTFTHEELVDNWTLMCDYRDRRLEIERNDYTG